MALGGGIEPSDEPVKAEPEEEGSATKWFGVLAVVVMKDIEGGELGMVGDPPRDSCSCVR